MEALGFYKAYMARATFIRTKYLDSSITAFKVAIDAFNSPINPYRLQASILLMVNAVELISKALLLKLGESIQDKDPSRTITAEKAVSVLFTKGHISDIEHQSLQQLISLRNEAAHSYLDSPGPDIVFFLLFCANKYTRALVQKHFKGKLPEFKDSFLSISTDQNVTYAEGVMGLMRAKKRDAAGRKLLYLLERGVRYEGDKYISQEEFEKEYRANKKKNLINRAAIGKYMEKADQLRVIFVQAPKHHSIDVTITKHAKSKNILPVKITQRDIYKNTTADLATALGVNRHRVVTLIKDHGIKHKAEFHQEIPNGKNPVLHRYSEAVIPFLKTIL